LALNTKGEVGAFAIQTGFVYAQCDGTQTDRVVPSKSVFV
jgi:N4-(beta-N-acetylglucosaminyl)-L-asparaginase